MIIKFTAKQNYSGAVYGWGKNSFGQLGLGDTVDRPQPTQLKSLRFQRVTYIRCGMDHTAALTRDGGVFTFGAGMYGQLGHCTSANEMLPRKVLELMGTTVTQICCGRCECQFGLQVQLNIFEIFFLLQMSHASVRSVKGPDIRLWIGRIGPVGHEFNW